MNPCSSRIGLAIVVATCAALAAGCGQTKTAPDQADAIASETHLKLLVVDDPAMAAAIDKLRAEWKARSGATLAVEQMSLAEFDALQALDPSLDAVIYPSRKLGPLAERGWIAPLPADFQTNRELAWPDSFELLKVVETVWATTPYAVAFGSPVLTCYYRPDLLERFQKSPPRTWSEFHALAEFFSHRENLRDAAPPEGTPWYGALAPLAEGWSGQLLLARAAAMAKHRDHYSTLFKVDTMEPLIAGAGFVRALEQIVAESKLHGADAPRLDVDAVRREFLAGHAALALAWPAHAASEQATEAGKLPIGFVELPGSDEVYDFVNRHWDVRAKDENKRATLLGLAGRLGSVNRQSAHAAAAFQLLAWLSGVEWGAEVSGASAATTLYRRSQLRAPAPWVDKGTDVKAAAEYALSVRDAMTNSSYLYALRIAGQDRYLSALDAAVRKALSGELAPQQALDEAAAQWNDITRDLGIEPQRTAYCHSLGIEP